MITGVNHITISVRDLAHSFEFYSGPMGFKPIARWPAGAYFTAGNLWFCLIEDKQTRANVLPEYTHIAFSVSEAEYELFTKRLRNSGVEIWKHNVSEGPSLYFLDPNGHKFEIHVGSLETRLSSMRSKNMPGFETFV